MENEVMEMVDTLREVEKNVNEILNSLDNELKYSYVEDDKLERLINLRETLVAKFSEFEQRFYDTEMDMVDFNVFVIIIGAFIIELQMELIQSNNDNGENWL